jgi:hypothetical protein
MPDKGRRVASRQAQLGRRKRRQSRGTSGASSDGATTAIAENQPADRVAMQEREPTTPAQDAGAVAPSRPAPASLRRSPTRARAERPMAYNYVGHELRRILILSGVLIVILVVLAFFL